MTSLEAVYLLLRLAWRNLVSHRFKSAVIGLVFFGNTLLLVLGFSLTGSMDATMERNITDTLAGHLHAYSAHAPEELELFGGTEGLPDIGVIGDFGPVRETFTAVENVKTLVPMGTGAGQIVVGNPLEQCLFDLRRALKGTDSMQRNALVERARALVLEHESPIDEELGEGISATDLERDRHDLERAKSDEFWQTMDVEPLAGIEFLENRIVPMGGEAELFFLSYVGTDLELFADSFPRFEIIKGQRVPEGQRGLLFNERVHERQLKNPVVRILDGLFKHVVRDQKPLSREAFDNRVKVLVARRAGLLAGLDRDGKRALQQALRQALPDSREDLMQQLSDFLSVTPQNLAERHQRFNTLIAPHIRLYAVDVGDTTVVHSISRAGYPTATPITVFGTFQFAGLEDFGSAAQFNLTDLATYRKLLGEPSAEDRAEMAAMLAPADTGGNIDGPIDENDLFGNTSTAEATDAHVRNTGSRLFDEPLVRSTTASSHLISPDDLNGGVIGHTAIVLHDPDAAEDTLEKLQTVNDLESLDLHVVTANESSGIVAEYLDLVRVQLYVGLGIVFLITLMIINTTIVVAVLARVQEIGTLRAIGTQRLFVTASVLCETALLGIVACGLGLSTGTAVVQIAQRIGIPAYSWVWAYLFGGPRLYPFVTTGQLVAAFAIAISVGLLAALYPARLATRVQPIVALRQGE